MKGIVLPLVSLATFVCIAGQPAVGQEQEERQASQERLQQGGPPKSQSAQNVGEPRLIEFSSTAKDQLARSLTGVARITFAIYKEQEGGAPLWMETQNVELDEQGRYTALLGATKSEGLPLELYTTREPRWVGVQVNLPDELEQPRVLLVRAPDALKMADAESLEGKLESANTSSAGIGSMISGATQGTQTESALLRSEPASEIRFRENNGPTEDSDMVRERAEWFYHQRAYPLKQIPRGVRLKAWREFRRMQEAEKETANLGTLSIGAAATSAGAAQWRSIGPRPINPAQNAPFGGSPTDSGRVRALAVDPTNPNVAYLGAAGGGVWKTTNGGQTWTPLTDTQASLAVGSIAIAPTNHNIIYVGTGEEVPILQPGLQGANYFGAGILKSTDGGNTWTLESAGGPYGSTECEGGAYIGALAVSPSSDQIVLAALIFPNSSGCENSKTSGIYRSTDGGATFTAVLTGAAGTSVLFDPSNGNRAYATLSDFGGSISNGVYTSADGGHTWSPDNGSFLHPLLPGTAMGWMALAIAPSSPQTLYLSVADPTTKSSNFGFFVYSPDGGADWFLLPFTPDYCSPQCYYDNVIAVAPNNPKVVYVGGVYQTVENTVDRSLDGGNTWEVVSTGANRAAVHTDTHALAFSSDSSLLYVGSDGGAWSTTNITTNPVNWTSLNASLAITTFYPGVSVDPTNLSNSFAGAQDNGTDRYSGSLTWDNVACGDGGWTAIDFTTPTIVYAACAARFPDGSFLLFKSTSGGTVSSWTLVNNNITASDRALFVPPLVMDPSNSKTLYYGTYRVYQTITSASSWQAISNDLSTGNGFVSTIAVAPSDSNTVYAGTSDSHVQLTTNALAGMGAGWHDISTGLPFRWVTGIAVDPTSPSTVYVTLSGFSGFTDNQGHVFKSTNQGVSWTDISGNLLNIPVNDIVIDPSLPNTYYIATDVGVFGTSNGGTTWSTLSSGLPNVVVTGLTLQAASRTLRAVTFGRGAWDLSLVAVLSLSPTSVFFGTQLVRTGSAPGTITLTNAGASGLAITGIAVLGANSNDFGLSHSCPISPSILASGASCILQPTFTPTAGGPRKSTISISDSAAGSPHTVILTGVGTVVGLSPTTLPFGSQAVGTPSAAQMITLKNMGTATMNLWQIAILGVNAGDFSQTNTCGSTLGAGASCTVSVTFKPTATGARSASVLVSNDGGGSPQAATLVGTGVAAAVSLSTSSSSFSKQATGTGVLHELRVIPDRAHLTFPPQAIMTSSRAQLLTLGQPRRAAR